MWRGQNVQTQKCRALAIRIHQHDIFLSSHSTLVRPLNWFDYKSTEGRKRWWRKKRYFATFIAHLFPSILLLTERYNCYCIGAWRCQFIYLIWIIIDNGWLLTIDFVVKLDFCLSQSNVQLSIDGKPKWNTEHLIECYSRQWHIFRSIIYWIWFVYIFFDRWVFTQCAQQKYIGTPHFPSVFSRKAFFSKIISHFLYGKGKLRIKQFD